MKNETTVDAPPGQLFYPAPGCPAGLIGLPRLMEMSLQSMSLQPVAKDLLARLAADPDDANALLDLSCVLHLAGNDALALRMQKEALSISRHFRVPAVGHTRTRLLVLMTQGDLAANMPVEFLLAGSNIELNILYLVPGEPIPKAFPDHDIACIGISESDGSKPMLRALAAVTDGFAKPIVNGPLQILALARESAWVRLAGIPGCFTPPSVRIGRKHLERISAGAVSMPELLPPANYPVICRPVGSHAGQGLVKLDDAASVTLHLQCDASDELVISPFIDYRSRDGLYRKYRVAFIGGAAFPVHLAISERWMIHYLNADMAGSRVHRAEEEKFFETFHTSFAVRHSRALMALDERLGLDYFSIDCGELPDGRLLFFEADTCNVVHAMDGSGHFAYKRLHMIRLFKAFQSLLADAAKDPSRLKKRDAAAS
jgi:hypothetical protein